MRSVWGTEFWKKGKRRECPPAPLFAVALGGVGGIWLEDTLQWGAPLFLAGCGLALVSFWSRLLWAGLVFFSFAGFAVVHHYKDTLSRSRPPPGLLGAETPRTAVIEGVVEGLFPAGDVRAGKQGCRAILRVDEAAPLGVEAGARMLVIWRGSPPEPGDRVKIRAALGVIEGGRNPGQFDLARAMRRQGIWVQALVRDAMDAEILEHCRRWRIGMLGPALSEAIAAELRRGIEDRPQTHALISSMVLGIHGDGLLEAKPAFRDTGTLHLFAVSGLNLTMLAGLLGVVLRGLRVGPAVVPWGVLPVLGAYALATGLGPSCIRALVMSVIVVLVPWVRRPAVALNSIGAAAVLLLLWNSNTLFEAGFQLSFVLVLALTLVAPRMGAFFERWAYPDALLPRRLWSRFQERRVRYWRPFAAGFAAALTVWIASVPWSLTLFHQITPVALFANLVAVPLAYVNLALGFVSLMLAPLGAVSPWLNRINASVAEGLYFFVDFASRVPGGHIPLASPWERRPEVLCFDFPGGGGVLLRSGGKACLVDCGSETQARTIVLPALRCFGVGRIDALLLSHGSAPYIGGAITVYEALHPGLALESVLKDRSRARREFREWLGAQGKSPGVARAGDRFALGPEASLEVLFPPDSSGGSLAQDKGLVLRWSTPGYSLLYTAAAGFPTERWLLEHCPEKLRADVWIRGWHPREMTGTDDFVRSISPRVIVLMAPRIANDPDGVERWVERRRTEGISVFSQKRSGAVLGYARGEGFECRSYLGQESALW